MRKTDVSFGVALNILDMVMKAKGKVDFTRWDGYKELIVR